VIWVKYKIRMEAIHLSKPTGLHYPCSFNQLKSCTNKSVKNGNSKIYVVQVILTNACLGFGGPFPIITGGGGKMTTLCKIFDKTLNLLLTVLFDNRKEYEKLKK